MAEPGSRLGRAREVNREATLSIRETTKEKLQKARADKRVLALEVIQVLLILMVALAAIFFIFPEKPVIRSMLSVYYPPEVVAEYLAQIPQPPWNYALFAIVVIAAIWVYHFTDWYRHERRQSKQLLSIELFIIFLIFMSIVLYFDPAVNIIPPPFSYLAFGALVIALAALFIYIRFFRK